MKKQLNLNIPAELARTEAIQGTQPDRFAPLRAVAQRFHAITMKPTRYSEPPIRRIQYIGRRATSVWTKLR